jgi:methyl-accepting chemotaxis protein
MDKVTQSNAASAEESAAAAEELNAQAETMKQSVMELLQLVGGNSQNTVTRTPSSPARRTVHIASPAAKRPAPVHGNGHARIQLEASGKTNGRNEIPMEGDFRDF